MRGNKPYLSEIWVYCEVEDAKLTFAAREILGKAEELAGEVGMDVSAVLFADASDAEYCGADKIYHFSPCREEQRADAIAQWLQQRGRPWAFLFPATAGGRLVAASLSVFLQTGLTADCTGLSIEDGYLKQTRPAFGGRMVADIFCRHSYPQMATVRRGAFSLPPKRLHRKARWVSCASPTGEISGIRVLRQNKGTRGDIPLEDAKIVLSGGMGLGTKENFSLLEQTAKLIGAVPAASRAAVNANLAPYAWQVGQSGKNIRPELYIACGISGAVQHLAGVQGAGCIVAVNSDPGAAIFACADIGILTDCTVFLRGLMNGQGAAMESLRQNDSAQGGNL